MSSCKFEPQHPQQQYTPGWHYQAKTPVVDGKYHDPKTGELCTASGHQEYSGPPAVDIVINSLHADTSHCIMRAARPFPFELLLYQIMQVVHDRKLTVDSLIATQYAIRITLAHDLTVDEFNDVALRMTNGIWDEK